MTKPTKQTASTDAPGQANDLDVPDPVLRHLDPRDIPDRWAAIAPKERSLRGRYALLAICAGMEPGIAWVYALDESADATHEIEEVVSALTDAQIEVLVALAEASPRRQQRTH